MDGNQGVGAGMALGLARAGMAGRSARGMGQVAVRCCGAPGGRGGFWRACAFKPFLACAQAQQAQVAIN